MYRKRISPICTGQLSCRISLSRFVCLPILTKCSRGLLSYVGDVLDTATRTMQVRLTLANPTGRLKPEMFATIRVVSEPAPDVLVVPEAAVQHDRDRSFVFVQQEPGVFEARTIKLGDKNGTFVEVREGLQEGEVVVREGAFTLKSELLKPKD